jgi:hypothetical protein
MTIRLVFEVYYIVTQSIDSTGAEKYSPLAFKKNQPPFHDMNFIIALSTSVDL